MAEIDIPTNFKTSLPPRKRAKTKEEKEQRRVERILRNRKAAHASREKKRKHVEFLESYVLDLEKQLHSFKELNGHLMENYQGGNEQVDSLVKKIQNLPDLNKKRHDHFMEIDAEDNELSNDSSILPKTPESFASSPKQNVDDSVPELMSPGSNSSMSESERSNSFMMQTLVSPQTSPITSNKFSLDIITGAEQSLASPVIKTEEEEVGAVDQSNKFFNEGIFIKKEDQESQLPPLSDDIFNDKLNFDEFQVNTYDNDFGFDELRNPAVITCLLKRKIS